jgi:Holliday junction resolvasome RuvABC endonuclease subunit
MTRPETSTLVLAIYPFTRGFSFVLFEGPASPFDWGVRDIREKHKNETTLAEIKKLIDRYRPEVLVIEDTTNGEYRRTSRIRKLYRSLEHLAEKEYVELHRYKKSQVKECFELAGACTKHDIAKVIAAQIPAFAHRMPPFRKAWMNEDPRQSLFDAAALALTFYQMNGRIESEDAIEI